MITDTDGEKYISCRPVNRIEDGLFLLTRPRNLYELLSDSISLVYDFGTPSHYYCIVKDVYTPDRLEEVLDTDVITSNDAAAIVNQKRP